MILKSVFDVISPRFQKEGAVIYSGFQDVDKHFRPFIHLSKPSVVLESKDTCGNRIERHTVQIALYHNDFARFKTVLDNIRDSLLYKKLSIAKRRFIGTEEFELVINEPMRSFYQGIYQYQILVEKAITEFNITLTSASDLFSALLARFKQTILLEKVKSFVTTNYLNNTRPFIFVPEYTQSENFITTCTRIDEVNFTLTLESRDFSQLEEITEDIDNFFSYNRFKLDDKKFVTIEWISNEFEEVEKGLWRSPTTYQVLLESNIN